MTESQDPQAHSDLLRQGIELARTGQRKEARAILEQVIRADERNEVAWLWLAAVLDNNRQRRIALEIVLEINPENERAREALAKLGGSRASQQAAAAQDLANRIGSTDTIDEADFQVALEKPEPEPASPEPEPVLTDAEKEAIRTRELLAAAQAEEAARAEQARRAEQVRRTEQIARAQELAQAEKAAPTDQPAPLVPDAQPVEYYDFARERRAQRARQLQNILGILVIVLAGAALVMLMIWGVGSYLQSASPSSTPTATPGLQTALAILATDTPTPTPQDFSLEDLNRQEEFYFPASWTPQPTVTATLTPSPTDTPPPLSEYQLIFSGRSAEETTFNLYTIWADGSALEQFTTAGTNDRDPAPSHSGEQLLFASDVDESRELALLPLGAEEIAISEDADEALAQTILTTLGATSLSAPSWSPDGSQIVFSAEVNDRDDLYLLTSDGESLINLTANLRGHAIDPAWSPDGEWIAFASDTARQYDVELYLMRADGTGVEQLTNTSGSSFQPSWSPDSQSIAFVSDRDNDADLYVINANGSGWHRLTSNNTYEERDPAWSPDGRWIAFSANRDSAVFQIYLLDPVSGDIVPVTDEQADFMEPAWLVGP